MKRSSLVVLGLVLTFALAACGRGKTDDNAQTETSQEQTQTQESTQPEETQEETTDQSQEGGASYSAEMENLKNAVVEALGENYWPNTTIEANMLADTYGVTEDMYEEYLGEMPMISTNVDTLIIIKAKDDQVTAVEDALNAYRDKLVNDTMQYPMNLGKIQASRIETIGNYVCFVQLGADVTDAMDQGEDVAIAQCQEENEKAIEAIHNAVTAE